MLIGLLEDDLAIQELLRLVLLGDGHQVVVYLTAEECLNDLRVDDPSLGELPLSLLIVDLRLAASVSGVAVIERIRANPRLEPLQIILTTASTSIDLQELQRLRVTLLSKPFDIDEVIRLVNELAGCTKLPEDV